MIYALALVLIAVGLYGVLVKRNLVRIILGLLILESGAHLFLIMLGYRPGGRPAILGPGTSVSEFAAGAVDPLVQAIVLTAIVIDIGILALLVALVIRLYDRYRTFDVTEIRRLRG
jgi:multicomponent Na+:H+ antiporter subunit C